MTVGTLLLAITVAVWAGVRAANEKPAPPDVPALVLVEPNPADPPAPAGDAAGRPRDDAPRDDPPEFDPFGHDPFGRDQLEDLRPGADPAGLGGFRAEMEGRIDRLRDAANRPGFRGTPEFPRLPGFGPGGFPAVEPPAPRIDPPPGFGRPPVGFGPGAPGRGGE